ncbi:MAG: chromosomal replication initiator protein DnaA [Epulopiscium sp.]|nr:chromosomal replication initiator protein DnaA [Candidatus Epulonipiscium sp.]
MNQRLKNQWQAVLEVIEPETSPVGYNTWFKETKLIGIEGNSMIIEVQNQFNQDILSTRYLPLIQNSALQVLNKEYDFEFVLPNSSDNVATSQKEANSTKQMDKIKDPLNTQSNLNPRYTFDTFVVGNSNRLAHAAALAVAESPAKAYNPLFIYGGVGLGKTHLMHSIAHYIASQNAQSKILYASSEKFTNELINSIRDDKNEAFRNKYRNIDILLIDDIQFVVGKERTQEEFFHTFNTLHDANKQIIISSDRPPKEIETLEERLRSRFEWGLIADIQTPDLETRIAILRKKAELEGLFVPEDVFLFIAKTIVSNIRELEGALNRIIAFSSLTNKPISVELANEALKDLISKDKPKVITCEYIQEIVAAHFHLKPEDFKSSKRTRSISYPRQIAMYLSRKLTDLSLPKIGNQFGGRDHTTIIHGYEKIAREMETDIELAQTINELEQKITGK